MNTSATKSMSLLHTFSWTRFVVFGILIVLAVCILQPKMLLPTKELHIVDFVDNVFRKSHSQRVKRFPVKVIIVAYMRSGSTFLGEFFDKNPEAFFWYEPIDGFYSHLYGTERGWYPLDIHYNKNLEYRTPPQYEIEYITESIHNVLNCNITALPVQTTNDATNLLRSAGTKDYRQCLQEHFQSNLQDTSISQSQYTVSSCATILKNTCPRVFTGNSSYEPLYACYEKLHQTKESPGYIKRYHDCVKIFAGAKSKCSDNLTEQCRSSRIRGFKTIRLSMSDVEILLKSDEDIKIVHLLRDPRAIIHSRNKYNMFSDIANNYNKTKAMILESKLLCDKMLRDINSSKTLQHQYPDSINEIRYEHLASNPIKVLYKLYAFINIPIPKDLTRTISATTKTDDGAFGTRRTNGSAIARAWRSALTKSQIHHINEECKDVLRYLATSQL